MVVNTCHIACSIHVTIPNFMMLERWGKQYSHPSPVAHGVVTVLSVWKHCTDSGTCRNNVQTSRLQERYYQEVQRLPCPSNYWCCWPLQHQGFPEFICCPVYTLLLLLFLNHVMNAVFPYVWNTVCPQNFSPCWDKFLLDQQTMRRGRFNSLFEHANRLLWFHCTPHQNFSTDGWILGWQ
jgi:hypothetical protein